MVIFFLHDLIKIMNSIGHELFKGISGVPSFFIILISIAGCSSEFKESFNQGFQSSFISSCMEPYERHANKKEISRIKFLNYCECTLDEMNKNGDVQLSSIMPGKFQEITDYCFQRELIPLK